MTATIFDIQRFSIHDGPGIRTTVFFKGCGMRCLWCHNPESQKKTPELMFYAHRCVKCGKCAGFCANALTTPGMPASDPDTEESAGQSFEAQGQPERQPLVSSGKASGNCLRCGECASVCPAGAREKSGKEETVSYIFGTVLRDRAYYSASGGGVTASGGEPLLQADAVAELFELCRNEGINTALETAGNARFSELEKLVGVTDLFLYDIKGIDAERHRLNTGVSNELILENARRLCVTGADVLFRMPVIPGYNDDEIGPVAGFARSLGKKLELLAYHNTGSAKYAAIGIPFPLGHVDPPTAEHMLRLAETNVAVYNPTGI
ncbi:MAG: glycyl-radical enzyme activating protein [Clostridia bacterium]|nr:glycyl-radical enzyme activating protein [Clostridia bacterium]